MLLISIAHYTGIFAQNAGYTFSQVAGTYTAFTGGTVWQSGTTISTNAVSSVLTLTSSFTFNGVAIDRIYISNNGFITLANAASNTAPSTTNYNPLVTIASQGSIAGYGFNLVASTVSGAAPEIRYGDDSGEFVVQFADVARTGITGDRMNFQIRLEYATSKITLKYGTWATTSTTTTASNFGVVGCARSATNYSARMVMGSAPYSTWLTSGGSGVNATAYNGTAPTGNTIGFNTMRYNNAYLPTSGLTYTWQLASNSFYQSLPYTQNFDTWSSSSSTTTHNDVPATTGVVNAPSAGHLSWRRLGETAGNAAWASVSGQFTGTQAGAGAATFNQYDAPAGVKGNLDFYLNCSAIGSKLATFYVRNPGTANANDVLNVLFSTDGGLTFLQVGTYAAPINTWTIQTINLGTTTSATCILRFEGVADYGSSAENLGIDELSVIAATCVAPTALASSAITNNSATISWTASVSSPADGYEYYYATTNTPPTAATTPLGTVGAGVTTANLTGLTQASIYYYWVRAACSATDKSNWSSVATFTTLCDPIAVSAATPWQEGFEGLTTVSTTDFPVCWLEGNGTNWASLNATTSTYHNARTGNNYVGCFYSGASNHRLWTPGFSLTAGQSYDFTTYMVGDNYAGWTADLVVNTSTSATGETVVGANIITPPTLSPATYTLVKRVFIAPTTGTYYFAIRVTSTTAPFGHLAFDDFKFEPTPTCLVPSALVSSAVTNNSATIAWTASPSAPADGYEYYYATTNTAPTAATTPSGTVAAGIITANLSALTSATTYYYWVRAACSAADKSSWAGSGTFTTACDAANIPYTQDFEAVTVPAIPTCMSIQNAGTGNNWITSSPAANGFTTKVARYTYNGTNAANAWLYTQGLNLTAGTTYRVRYKYGSNSTAFTEKMRVAYGTSPTATAMTTQLADHPTINQGTLQNNTVVFTPATTGVYFVGFNCYSASNQNALFLDDIIVDFPPTCIEPSALVASSVTSNSATISWTASSSAPADGYEYYVATTNTAPTAATPPTGNVAAGITTANLSSLVASTPYFYWVRSVCSSSDKSIWLGAGTFTTPCSPATIPFVQSFDGTAGSVPACWSNALVSGTNNWIVATGGGDIATPYAGTGFMSKGYNTSEANLFSQTIDFTTLTAGQQARLNVYLHRHASAATTDKYNIYVNTTPSTTGATQLLEIFSKTTIAPTVSATGWYNYVVDIPTSFNTNANVYIIVKGTTSSGFSSYELGLDDFKVELKPAIDMAATALLTPIVSGCFSNNETVAVRLTNFGTSTIDFANNNATVTCDVSGGSSATLSTVLSTGTLAAGAMIDVALPGALDMTVGGTYNFAVQVTTVGDSELPNNALPTQTRTALASSPTNYIANFDANTSIPTGWANVVNSFLVAASHGKSGNGLYKNYYSSSATGEIRTLRFTNVSASDNLMFDTRVVNFTSYPATAPAAGWGSVDIMISTDCGVTYTVLSSYNDINSLTWSYKQISLSAYAGQSVMIKLRGNYTTGDWFWDIDNFKIGGCLLSSGVSMLSTNVNTLSTMCGDASTGNYTYYGVNVGGANQYCMAINWGTNFASKADAEANNRITMFKNGATGAPVSQGTAGATGTATLGYYWNVDLTGLTQLTTPVAVRFYYVPADLTAVTTAAATYGTASQPVWFKTVGSQFSYTSPSSPITGQWIGMQTLTASLPTVDANGQTYVELTGINSFSGGSVAVGGGVATPLPITMKSLSAIEKGATNLIKWETATEQNVRIFAVEKSIDGKNWKALGTVVPNTAKRYEMIDAAPATNMYYRVRNIDNDGREDVSEIVSVNRKSGKLAIASIAPNPTTDDMKVKIETTENTTITIHVVDVVGRVVMTQSIEALNGFNTVTLNTAAIQSGTYFLVINDGVSTLTERIVKQ
jgi:Secretion system C-terminal sorting domain/Fibronectin type III domain